MKHAIHRQPFGQIMNFQNYVSPIVRVIPGQYAGLPSQFEGIRTTIRIDQSWFVL
ncbi:MAG: hypothetical protein H7340_07225 [Variovorax sp.]|nr:hypothetical protein [Variovorax sp.]